MEDSVKVYSPPLLVVSVQEEKLRRRFLRHLHEFGNSHVARILLCYLDLGWHASLSNKNGDSFEEFFDLEPNELITNVHFLHWCGSAHSRYGNHRLAYFC